VNGFFSSGAAAGETISLSELHNQFYRYLPSIKNRIFESLSETDITGAGRTAYGYVYAGGVVVGFLSIWGAMPLATMLGWRRCPLLLRVYSQRQ